MRFWSLCSALRRTWSFAPLLLLLATSCGSNDDGDSGPPGRHQVVMVIDDGFDPHVPGLQGKVVGSYTLTCSDSDPMDPASMLTKVLEAGGDLAAAKTALLATLETSDDDCTLTDGIAPAPDPLASIAKYRDRWNALVRTKGGQKAPFSPVEMAEIQAALEATDDDAPIHGTATAGLVAYENPNVRLVLVNRPLRTAQNAQATFTCPNPKVIGATIALLMDPEVLAAVAAHDSEAKSLRSLVARHGVGVVNESYGGLTRQVVEGLLAQNGCPSVDLGAYFSALSRAQDAVNAANPLGALLVKSAGNESSAVDGPEDSGDLCAADRRQLLTVGSLDADGTRSGFSNFGTCVDVYAPGDDIIVTIPGNWLLPLSGTSFSAPLVARWLSRASFAPFSPEAGRARVLAAASRERQLPVAAFPAELLFDLPAVGKRQALRAASTASPSSLRALLREAFDPLAQGR